MGQRHIDDLGIAEIAQVRVEMQIAELRAGWGLVGRRGGVALVDVDLAGFAIGVKGAGHQLLILMKLTTQERQRASNAWMQEARFGK